MLNYLKQHLYESFAQIAELDDRLIIFVGLLMVVLIVLEDILVGLKELQKKSGLITSNEKAISIDDLYHQAGKDYVSEVQGIAGRPDAVIKERGFFIPVERKPLSNKVRDRYIAQLLVYMRLIEEFEGKKPPYGYLIVGKNARKVTIQNTYERQAWLTEKLTQMRSIVEEKHSAKAEPHPRKCKRCKMRNFCDERADH